MEKLMTQLVSNNEALDVLKTRYKETLKSVYYNVFKTESERNIELEWILKIQKRVLNLRYRILENIQSETIKMMQETSSNQKQTILKEVA